MKSRDLLPFFAAALTWLSLLGCSQEGWPPSLWGLGRGDAPSLVVWVTGPDGGPVPGARLRRKDSPLSEQVVTDQDGRATYRFLHSGRPSVPIYVEADGLATAACWAAPDAGELKVRLAPGRSLEGRSLGPRGKPLSGALVRARPIRTPYWDSPVGQQEAESDGAGRFRLEGLLEDDLYLQARARGFVPVQKVIPLHRWPESLTIRFERGLDLEVLVRGPDGSPCSGAEVRVTCWRPAVNDDTYLGAWTTGEDGFVGISGVPKDVYKIGLQASKDDGEMTGLYLEKDELTICRDGVQHVELHLREPRTFVRATVKSHQGSPIPGYVQGLCRHPEPGRCAVPIRHLPPVGPDGVVELRQIPEGCEFYLTFAWRPEASATSVGPLVKTEWIRAEGRRQDVNLQLPPLFPVRLRFDTPNGAGLKVRVSPASPPGGARLDGSPSGEGLLGREGRLELLLPKGRYRVEARRGGWIVGSGEIVAGGGREDWVLPVEQGGTLSGGVKDELGRPGAYKRVTALCTDLYSPSTITDGEGRFVLPGLPGPAKWLAVEGPGGELFGLTIKNPSSLGGPLDLVIPLGEISGQVIDAETGAPLAATVRYLKKGDDGAYPHHWRLRSRAAATDRGGWFRLSRLSQGAWKFEAEVPGYEKGAEWVDVGGASRVTLALDPVR